MNKDSLFAKLDYTLIFIVFLLFCVSLTAIYCAPLPPKLDNNYFVLHQLIWYIVGAMFAVGVLLIDYDRFRQIGWVLYGICLALLVGLFLAKGGLPVPFAHESHGAYSWYALPGIGSVQPSEFMKIALILVLSRLIVEHNEENPNRSLRDDVRLLWKMALASLPPLAFVLIQPDLGTVLVMAATVLSMILVSGVRWRLILAILLAIILGIAALVVCYFTFPAVIGLVLQQHQLDRFYGWLAPYKYSNQEGFQLINSLNAIGSGQLYGTGFGNQTMVLPESYNDFIFSVVGNAFGFFGASALIALFFLLIYRIIHAALKTHDPFGTYICTGIIGMLMFTIFENIGMTIQVMPITGIPLPFISYGGSSLLTNMMSIGLVLSIQARSRKYMFD